MAKKLKITIQDINEALSQGVEDRQAMSMTIKDSGFDLANGIPTSYDTFIGGIYREVKQRLEEDNPLLLDKRGVKVNKREDLTLEQVLQLREMGLFTVQQVKNYVAQRFNIPEKE